MSRSIHLPAGAALLVSLCTLTACFPPEPQVPLTKSQVLAALDGIIFDSTITCNDLRESFNVDYLPLVNTPAEIDIPYAESYVPTADGQVIHIWYLPAAADRGTVVFSQGAVGTMACYLFNAQVLLNTGWSVVLYEYRGLGASSGVPSMSTIVSDLSDVVDWARARTGNDRVTLMGVSLGTIPSVAVAVQRPDVVNGVILDSPVALGDEIDRFGFLIGNRADEFISFLDDELLSERIIVDMQAPLLMLVSGRDALTLARTSEELYERAPVPKTLVRFPGIGHARAVFRVTEQYATELDAFLATVWPPRTAVASADTVSFP